MRKAEKRSIGTRQVVVRRLRASLRAVAGAVALATLACGPGIAGRVKAGNEHFEAKRYAEAIVEFQAALQENDQLGEVRYRLGEAYAAVGNPERAYREFVRAADLLPRNADAQIKAATYLIIAGQYADARTRISSFLARDPDNVRAQIVLGNALAGLRDMDGAVQQLEEAIRLDPNRSQSYGNLGLLRAARMELAEARAAFEKAVELDPKSIQAHLALANFLWSSGTAAEAEQVLTRALKLDPAHDLTNRALAVLYLTSNRAAAAEPHLKAIATSTKSLDSRLAVADYYALLGRRADAMAVLRELSRERVAYGAVQSRRAALDFASGRRTDARARLERLLEREPNNPAALLLKARWLFAEGQLTDALQWANAAVNADERSVEARYLVGSIHAVTRRTTDAIQAFNEVLRLNPRVVAAQVQLARLHLARGAADSAVQFADEALQNAPNHLDARIARARAWVVRYEIPRAEAEAAQLLKLYPNEAAVHSFSGLLRMRRGDQAAARKLFERALEIDPGFIEALDGITTVDVLEQRAGAARARLEARLAAEPRRSELLLLTGRFLVDQNDAAAAEPLLRTYVDLAPTHVEGYALLGRALADQNKLQSARAEFDAFAGRNPRTMWPRVMAAMIVDSQGDSAEAVRRYEEILRLDPNAGIAANNLAWIYAEKREDLDRALALAESAVAYLPDQPEAFDTLGWIYYRKGLPRLAVAPFQQSVDRDPENATYHFHLALAHAAAGDKDLARRATESAIKLQPDYAEARRFLATLIG